jgi:hypothetical protein
MTEISHRKLSIRLGLVALVLVLVLAFAWWWVKPSVDPPPAQNSKVPGRTK